MVNNEDREDAARIGVIFLKYAHKGYKIDKDPLEKVAQILHDIKNKPQVQGKTPTREQYAKWVSFYITAIDDPEARSAGCAIDGLNMLRDLYKEETKNDKA